MIGSEVAKMSSSVQVLRQKVHGIAIIIYPITTLLISVNRRQRDSHSAMAFYTTAGAEASGHLCSAARRDGTVAVGHQ